MKIVIGVLTLSLFIFGCSGNPQPAASKQAQTDTQTVEVVAVASQKLATSFTLPAQLILSCSQRRTDCAAVRTGTRGATGAGGIRNACCGIAIVHGKGQAVFG
jgi:PBP1b-binding outer membrane lipoprotein LpoB